MATPGPTPNVQRRHGLSLICWVLALVAAAAAVPGFFASDYTFDVVEVGKSANETTWRIVPKINAHGQVAGFESPVAPGHEQPMMYDGSKLVTLPTLGGAWGETMDINDAGLIVGESADAQGQAHAVAWRDGKIIDLGVAGSRGAGAFAVDAAGDAVGAISPDGSHNQAVLFRQGKIIPLGTLGGDSVAYGINTRGDIVGVAMAGDGKTHPFLYRDQKMQDLGFVGQAAAINDDGAIAGTIVPAENVVHVIAWRAGKVTDLGVLGGEGYFDLVWAITADGSVLGASRASKHVDAFMSGGGKLIDLNGIVTPDMLAARGWKDAWLFSATGAAADGTIVGEVQTPNEDRRTAFYILRPATHTRSWVLLVAALVLVTLGVVLRRRQPA